QGRVQQPCCQQYRRQQALQQCQIHPGYLCLYIHLDRPAGREHSYHPVYVMRPATQSRPANACQSNTKNDCSAQLAVLLELTDNRTSQFMWQPSNYVGERGMGKDYTGFYINGKWVQPDGRPTLDVINPATEKPFTRISLGTAEDVDSAAKAARAAFASWSQTSREERLAILDRILAGIKT